jgi:hypothetical protein
MPLPPMSMRYTCTRCSWSKRVSPKSDCLLPHEYFTSCPNCASPVTVKEDAVANVINRTARLLGIG